MKQCLVLPQSLSFPGSIALLAPEAKFPFLPLPLYDPPKVS